MYLVVLASHSSFANETHQVHSTRHTDAHNHHIHGVANLNVVQEHHALILEFHAPALDVLGFEGIPLSDEQKAILKRAKRMLTTKKNLFKFKGVNCTQQSRQTNLKDQQAFSDINASYRFICDEEDGFIGFSTSLFDAFPDIRKIEAQWITESYQGASTLTAAHPYIQFGDQQ